MNKRYFTTRTVQMVVTFVAVITLSFALIWLMPGGPAALIRAQFQEQARPMSEQEIAARVELYTSVNPDKPIPAAYLDYVSAVLTGDLGESIWHDRTVAEILADEPLRLTTVDPDGGGWEPLSETLEGSGYPILHPDGRTMVTDAYLHEDAAFDDGTVPLRVIDLETETERTALRIPSEPTFSGPYNMMRVDPHPAWGPSHRFVAFNGCPDGKRRVYITDFVELVGE